MIDTLNKELKRITEYFLDETIPMEEKNFYLVLCYLFPVTLITIIMSPLCNFEPEILILSFVFLLMVSALTYIVYRYKQFKVYSVILCICCCFFMFPLLFVMTGGIYNAVPVFWASGIIITFFLVYGVLLWVLVISEMLFYAGFLFYCYQYPQIFELSYKLDLNIPERIILFSMACVVPIFIIIYQTIVYNRIKVKIEHSYNSIHNAELSKIRFLANMTHEIRTPMNAIVGMNELILKEDLSPGAREQAEVIKEASSQLLRIVNNILIYSKLDSKKWEPTLVKYSFDKVMRDVIKTVSRGMQEEGSEFYVFIDRMIPMYLYGDEQGIKQIFMYLLFNSIQQKNRRSMSLEIKTENNPDNHTVRIKCRIAETGKGLPEADVDSILGAYKKYDSRRNATLKGMGLEISICKELLAMMDGFLRIESVVGVGTAIVFEFSNYIIDETPMLSLDEQPDRSILIYLHDKDEESIWKQLMEDISISPVYVSGPISFQTEIENVRFSHIFVWERDYEVLEPVLRNTQCENITYIITDYRHVYKDFGNCRLVWKPISSLNIIDILNGNWKEEDYKRMDDNEHVIFPSARILVVDDSIVNLKVLSGVLDNFKVSVDTASNGNDCLRMVTENKYDMILLDQMMPGMDGIETLHRLKQISDEISSIPVLCITAEIGRDVLERLIEQGFQDYVAKPVKNYHLARLLKKYLSADKAVIVNDVSANKTVHDSKEEKNETPDDSIDSDPFFIDVNKGIETVGGNDIYLAILNTYYVEGMEKLNDIPNMLGSADLSLFTTTVHALKSSSASIGALNISDRFKKLEHSGKENNRDYIDLNVGKVLDDFGVILNNVKSILIENDAFISDSDSNDSVSSLEETFINRDDLLELQVCLNNVNLKRAEEIIGSLVSANYGDDTNAKIREIKNSYEMFDYHKVKELLSQLIESVG